MKGKTCKTVTMQFSVERLTSAGNNKQLQLSRRSGDKKKSAREKFAFPASKTYILVVVVVFVCVSF